jgi:hypothetical protein
MATDGEDVVQFLVEAETHEQVLEKAISIGNELGVTRFLSIQEVT